MLSTPNVGIPYPELADTPNAPTQLLNLASTIDTVMVPRFASTAARDAAIPTPVTGQLAFTTVGTGREFLQKYSAGAWQNMTWTQTIVKETDTARTSTITPTADPDFQFSAAANSRYICELRLIVTSTTNGVDMRSVFAGPAGTAGSQSIMSVLAASTSASAQPVLLSTELFGVHSSSGVPTPTVVFTSVWSSLLTAGTAGTISFNWAQLNSSATPITIKAGSHMKVTQVS